MTAGTAYVPHPHRAGLRSALVDTHAHIFRADSPVVEGARYRPAQDASVGAYLEHLDAHSLAYGVLIQPSFLGVDNHQMLNAIAAHPHRLKGIAVIPPHMDDEGLRELDARGVVGTRLNLFGQEIPDLRAPQWRKLLARLEALGWQIELHCPSAYLRTVLPMLRDYAGPVVLDHFGRVDPDKGIADPDYQAVLGLLDPARHWVKVSGFYRLGDDETGRRHARQALQSLLNRGMRERLVWGSDWPHTQYADRMDYETSAGFLNQLVPDAVLRAQILGVNARALFGFPP